MAGFIHDKLDMKLLVLYLLSRTAAPIDFPALTDLVMSERGVDYFLFAESVAELADSGHLTVEDGLYAATEKGRRNSADSESSLSPVVRRRCDQLLETLNADLRRREQVRAHVEDKGNGEFVLHLSLNDDTGNLFSLELLSASEDGCQDMARRFLACPETVYHGILNVLLGQKEGDAPCRNR